MDNEKINELAAKLAQRLYNDDESYHATLWWGNEPKERKAEELEFVLKFLLETHCIVEKKEVAEWVNDIEFFMPDNRSVTMLKIGAKNLFGSELFNGKEKL